MSRFASLKLAELKPLLTSIGAKTSGTKAQLVTQLERELQTPRLTFPSNRSGTRILSIDMGIKNLAYCVCNVRKPRLYGEKMKIDVVQWKRIGVMDGLESASEEEAFGPPMLSRAAWKLVSEVLWTRGADTVLIERQRFRSGGGSAVLEWTLRVNMLESMIWAIARSLDAADRGFSRPDLWPVNPKQVASFWVDNALPEGGRTTATRSKVEKKQKIDLVHKWLAHGTGDENLELAFADTAVATKLAFEAAARGNSIAARRSRILESGASVAVLTKLDDLADCLLQAAAWCKWEQNRSSLASEDSDASQMIQVAASDVNQARANGTKVGLGSRRKSEARSRLRDDGKGV